MSYFSLNTEEAEVIDQGNCMIEQLRDSLKLILVMERDIT
mgnify:CR=1 FL=1